jgi:hypothetical protein
MYKSSQNTKANAIKIDWLLGLTPTPFGVQDMIVTRYNIK